MWFKMAALKVYTAVTVILVILMCGRTTSAVACTDDNCVICSIPATCTRCKAGFFLDGAGACVECQECGSDEYLKTPCGESKDAECLTCSDETNCVDGYYVSSPCTDTADRICTACRVCARGKFENGGCEGTNNTVCTACTTNCDANKYISTRCNSTANAVCATCTPCPNGTFEVAPCDGINDRECAACTDECPNGYFRKAECTPTANLQCKACGCADHEFITNPEYYCGPNTTKNYVCERCQRTCLPDLEYVANECGSYEDTDCKPCDPPCGKGQYESTPCNGVTNRKCTNCTKCGPGEVEKKPCRLKADRVCEKKRSPKATLLQNCKNKFAQRIRLGFRCQQVLCKNVPSYRRLYDCSRFLLTKRQPVFPSFG